MRTSTGTSASCIRHLALAASLAVAGLAPHTAHASRQDGGLAVAAAAAGAAAAIDCPSIRYTEKDALRDVALWAGGPDAIPTGSEQRRSIRAMLGHVRGQMRGMSRAEKCRMAKTFLRDTARKR